MVTKVNGNSTSTFGGDVDVTGNVITDAPTFSAYLATTTSSGTPANGTRTKVPFDTELWDSHSDYDNSTNYRYTPSVAGYYQINCGVIITGTSKAVVNIYIYKNGSEYNLGLGLRYASSSNEKLSMSNLVYCNGSTDYLEVYALQQGATNATLFSSEYSTFFNGFLARAV